MEKIIDIHSHLFNLKYLPVAGILKRRGGIFISHYMATTIEHFLIKNTQSNFDVEEDNFIKSIYMQPIIERLNIELDKGDLKDFYNLAEEQIINGIMSTITEEQISNPLVKLGLEDFQTKLREEKLLSEDAMVDLSFYDQESFILDNYILEKLWNLVKKMIEWVCSKVSDLINYFKWFHFMQRSEKDILQYLMKYDEVGVDIYIHHMMDVDYYFNTPGEDPIYASHFDFVQKQILNMQKLNDEYPNKIYAFVAFDPSKPKCVEIVKDAIKNRGFKGVKFYPPMGYRAFNDVRFKENIEKLFDYCIIDDIPIFTHCNKQGFEAYPKTNSGYNSHPKYWESILIQDKYKSLRLCLAHAGGVQGWFKKNTEEDEVLLGQINDLPENIEEKQDSWNKSYAKIVYKLCVKYENVYCDAAYLDEITDAEKYKNFRDRLAKLYNAEPKFIKKIIYGSDWHMLFQEGKNDKYLDSYKTLFAEGVYTDEQRQCFFRQNALDYLNWKMDV